MHILVMSDRCFPEITAPSVRIRDHASRWIELGHEVTVVTCNPNFPHGKLFPGYTNRLYQEEIVDGVRVVRLWSYMAENTGVFRRSLDYLSYMISAIFFFWKYPSFDVLIATSPTFFTAIAGYLVARLRRRPWVFEVRDLWPASIRAVGVSRALSRGVLLRLIERLELFLYRRSERVIVLAAPFKEDLVSRGIAAEKIDVITNGVNLSLFDSSISTEPGRQLLGLDRNKFVVGHIGTTGLSHGLTSMVEAAALCRDRQDIEFLILGEGAARPGLEDRARVLGLDNIKFRNFVSHQEIPKCLRAVDVAIVTARPDPLFEKIIRAKIPEFMAMGVPLVVAMAGESARIVQEARSGICTPVGDAKELAKAVTQLAGQRAACSHMGHRGIEVARQRFDRQALAEHVIRSLTMATNGRFENPDESTDMHDTKIEHRSRRNWREVA